MASIKIPMKMKSEKKNEKNLGTFCSLLYRAAADAIDHLCNIEHFYNDKSRNQNYVTVRQTHLRLKHLSYVLFVYSLSFIV